VGDREVNMADFDVGKLAADMGAAALGVLKDKWPSVKTYAEGEFAKLAQTVVTIKKGVATGEINPQEAALLMDMQKNAGRAVMLTVEGMSLLAVEGAINAALAAVRTAVNAALGFALV
jgi:hypothetical protein